MKKKSSIPAFWLITLGVMTGGGAAAQDPLPFDYDYSDEAELAARIDVDNPDPDMLRGIFERRRQRVLQSIPGGAMLIFSVEGAQ